MIRWFRTRSPRTQVALVVAIAAALRLGLIALGWPRSNSDEGTIGIMALHIRQGRDFPAFFSGDSYMGAGQAYVGAALFFVLGPSLFALRAGLVILFVAFLLALYRLGRLLYGHRVALASIALLGLGSREMLGNELVAYGGPPETLLLGTSLLLVATTYRLRAGRWTRGQMTAAHGAWGLLAGLAVWSELLTMPFVVASGVLLVLPLRPSRRRGAAAGVALLAGVLLGMAPLITFNLGGPPETTWQAWVRLYADGGSGHVDPVPTSRAERFVNATFISTAVVSGGNSGSSAGPPAWPAGWDGASQSRRIGADTAVWGGLVAVLGAAATVHATRRRDRGAVVAPPLRAARFALMGAAGMTFAAFAASRAPGLAPANSSRYLVGVLVALPAVIAAGGRVPARGLRRGLATAVVATLAFGTAVAWRDAVRSDGDHDTRVLAAVLEARDIHAVFSDYWTCNRLSFLSNERVVCAVRDGPTLAPGFDRYLPYRAAADADPSAAYVYRRGSLEWAAALRRGRAATAAGPFDVFRTTSPS